MVVALGELKFPLKYWLPGVPGVEVCGSLYVTGPVSVAKTRPESPAPEGPGRDLLVLRLAETSSGKPVCHWMMGKRLHPCVRRLGPFDQAWSKGRSQPPLKLNRWRISKSEEVRKTFLWKKGTSEFRLRKPEELSMVCDQV